MIIDFHTHIFPDKIAGRTIDILEQNIEQVEGCIHKAFIPATHEALLGSMQKQEVDYSVVLPIATTPTQSPSINRFAAQINGKDHLFSFGSIHPLQPDWEAALEEVKEYGLPGIKLHPEYQQVFVDSPEYIHIFKKAEELGLLVVLHAGLDIGVKPPSHGLPVHLSHVLQEVSGEGIIAAHMGGYRAWDEVERYLVGTPIRFDTSFSLSEIPKEQALRLIRSHGAEKILFGTDSPWEKPSDTLSYLNALELTPAEMDLILSGNAKKLLKI